MAEPAISVIMNCLNCAADLPAALASVKAQTFQDFEIIFWDNGSTDDSAEIAQNYGNGLRYFYSRETVPLGCARNLAISAARGEYIAFLDCDDLWRPTKLEKQIALFRANPAVGLVCTDTEISDGEKVSGRVFAGSPPARGRVFAELVAAQWISMSSAMLSRAALDGLLAQNAVLNTQLEHKNRGWFDETMNVCEEADVFYRIAHDWELDYVDESLTVWRVHGANTTFRKFGQFADETLAILAKHRLLYPDYDQNYGETASLLARRAAFQKSVALWRNGENSLARKTIAPYLGGSSKNRLFWLASFLPGSTFDFVSRLYFGLPAFMRR